MAGAFRNIFCAQAHRLSVCNNRHQYSAGRLRRLLSYRAWRARARHLSADVLTGPQCIRSTNCRSLNRCFKDALMAGSNNDSAPALQRSVCQPCTSANGIAAWACRAYEQKGSCARGAFFTEQLIRYFPLVWYCLIVICLTISQ